MIYIFSALFIVFLFVLINPTLTDALIRYFERRFEDVEE